MQSLVCRIGPVPQKPVLCIFYHALTAKNCRHGNINGGFDNMEKHGAHKVVIGKLMMRKSGSIYANVGD